MARIPLPTRDDLSDELKPRWDRLAARGPILDIQRLFLVNPDLDVNALKVWRASGLTDRAREIVILRAAFVQKSVYEWHQHVRIARGVGLPEADINAVRDWRSGVCFSADERALLAYVDALAEPGQVSGDVFAAAAAGRPNHEVLAVTYLITLYFQLARIMAVMELRPETPFVGWEVSG